MVLCAASLSMVFEILSMTRPLSSQTRFASGSRSVNINSFALIHSDPTVVDADTRASALRQLFGSAALVSLHAIRVAA